uniref:Uncharacterized protein n=1 Tax=Ascaris lumbricoides TaxID=6252 RepID=A0A0M3HWT2_ASCLU
MKLFFLACFVSATIAEIPKFAQSVATRSTGAKGIFFCGKNPAGDTLACAYAKHTICKQKETGTKESLRAVIGLEVNSFVTNDSSQRDREKRKRMKKKGYDNSDID